MARAVISGRADMLTLLLDLGFDPDERHRSDALDDIVYSWGEPLRTCAIAGKPELAEILLKRGADPNPSIYAASTPMFEAYQRGKRDVDAVLERYGGFADALVVGHFGLIDRARQMLADEAAGRLQPRTGPDSGTRRGTSARQRCGRRTTDIVRLALEHLDWPPGDERWHWHLMRPLGTHAEDDRDRYVKCFQLMVERAGANAPGPYGRTILHDICAGWPRDTSTAAERVALATIVLDAGARLDLRDDLLKSTPLGWACRWGRLELVALFLERGADPVEADSEAWATPRAWAEKMKHESVVRCFAGPPFTPDKSRSVYRSRVPRPSFPSQRAGGGAFGLPFSSTWIVLTGPMPTSTRTAGSFSPSRAPSQCTVFALSMATVPACTG